MPFTVSHAVVALPFARSPIPFGAVAVGSMAPDLPLFFAAAPPYAVTHGFPGVLVTTVPLAIVLYAIWRLLLRPASLRLLPSPPALREALLIVVALVLGVVTHVVWDAFTHPGRFGSTLVPLLAEEWGPLAGTQWLQYASSVGGLTVIAVVGMRYVARTAPEPVRVLPRLRAALGIAILLAATGSAAVALAEAGVPSTITELRAFAFDAGTSAGAAILVVTGVAACVALIVTPRPAPPAG